MSVRGTRNLLGGEADRITTLISSLEQVVRAQGYQQFLPSALAEAELFVDKAGPEVLSQMYVFPDRKGRQLCLIPEVTAVVQNLYKTEWANSLPKPVRIYYATRCCRYERPQAGRYREFWQFGVESLGGSVSLEEVIETLKTCLCSVGLKNYQLNQSVKRGLSYYTEDGFEVEVAALGAQKQVAGGGRYDCGIGWAIGVDRLALALEAPQ